MCGLFCGGRESRLLNPPPGSTLISVAWSPTSHTSPKFVSSADPASDRRKMRLPLALLLGAAYALHPPPTNGLRKRNLYRTQTQYKTDSADGAGSFDRAVDALRAKGDAAAVKALRADIKDIVVKIDGVDVDVTSRDGGVLVVVSPSSRSRRWRRASTPSSRRGERDTVAAMA